MCVCVPMHRCSVRTSTFLIETKMLLIARNLSRCDVVRAVSPHQTTFFWRLHSAAAQTAGSIQHFLQEPEKNASILGDGLRTRNAPHA